MRNISFGIILFLIFSLGLESYAQNLPDEPTAKNPIEEIVETSEGNIEIEIPDNILNQLLASPAKKKSSGSRPSQPRSGIYKTQGFRIQVFSDGRNQHSLEARAKARGNAIVAKFPKYRGQVYTFSSSPNWYTRVGNFTSSAEANHALSELKRAFPAFAAEMRIVRSQITIIK